MINNPDGNENQKRQGDVLVVKLSPEEAAMLPNLVEVENDGNRTVLAYGEVTGHAHALYGDVAVKLWDPVSGDEYVQVNEDAPLSHEEHSKVSLPKSLYKVIIQRQYIPGSYRNVAD